ncbi:MAG: hypothetical protein H7245_03455 [Candidatus Saccharibacteria bacterium]|nr:hypothetical protein [Pseudorhodobacter sp.]
MVRTDADHIPFDKIRAAGRQPFASVETDIGFGLFDGADDRIDSDGNPLEEMDDDEFDDTADAQDED